MKVLARLGVVALLIASSVLHPGSAAVAQPANDRIADAQVVAGLPFSAEGSTVGAGVDDGDPSSCFGSTATVWYRWVAAQDDDVLVEAVTDGFAAAVEVYIGGPDGFVGVVCGAGAEPFRQLFSARAGATYYIGIGACCDGGRSGGTFVVDLLQGPPMVEETVVVDRRATVERVGRVTVTGTVTCSREANIRMTLHLSQKRGKAVVSGSAEIGMNCGLQPSPWRAEVTIDPPDVTAGEPLTFRPGPARLTVLDTACDEFRCFAGEVLGPSRLVLRR